MMCLKVASTPSMIDFGQYGEDALNLSAQGEPGKIAVRLSSCSSAAVRFTLIPHASNRLPMDFY